MPKVKNVEKQIRKIEGFDVNFTRDGKNVRGDKKGFNQWDGKKQSKNNMTACKFEQKFQKRYPGYDVEILDGNGDVVTRGQTNLGTIRDSY